LIFMSVGAGAQTNVSTDVVDVELTGTNCDKLPSAIDVVLNGDDQHSFPVGRSSGPCHWHGRRSAGAFTITPNRSVFSLRLRGARTQCRYATPVNYGSVAQLTFDYHQSASAFDLDITPRDKQERVISFPYVREVHADDPEAGDLECPEIGSLRRADHVIRDVNFDVEDLRLRLSSDSDPGLLVNHPKVLNQLKKGSVTLSYDKVLDALASQTGDGSRKSRPRNPHENSYQSDEKTLGAIGLTTLAITVP